MVEMIRILCILRIIAFINWLNKICRIDEIWEEQFLGGTADYVVNEIMHVRENYSISLIKGAKDVCCNFVTRSARIPESPRTPSDLINSIIR